MSTVFQLHQDGKIVVCKNQDVIYDGVFLFTNHRGIRKTALMLPPALPATWVSRYGSLTVSQNGKESPNGGMNEQGLVVEQTTLWTTEHPPADDKHTVNELQWIQYMLDTCATVMEVLQAAATLRIDQSTSKLHYLIADRSGDCTIIEFLNGNMQIYEDHLSAPIMANSPYAQARDEIMSGITDWTGRDEYEQNSMKRVLAVWERTKKKTLHSEMVDFGFETLEKAKREDTVFSIVYDLANMEIHANTNRNRERRKIRIAEFDFSKESPSLAADLQKLQGPNAREQFVAYTTQFNHNVVHSFFRDENMTSIFHWDISDEVIRFLAQYPESFG
ncbi:linear amide C-N hydrolase [Paenibacillus thiaminolyticus]|uniref:linear amide C-N hydrolase n=1 Tax=Paenibacillus thiaminolyticus TaxID=49283 RepID=UPI001162DC3B|nr:linear amide C-N hydrolase [Paenibacillus thiaminolyticus]NGP62154.1 linear amide C-N hydrolase [Paenibacillus thiaminolyticus]